MENLCPSYQQYPTSNQGAFLIYYGRKDRLWKGCWVVQGARGSQSLATRRIERILVIPPLQLPCPAGNPRWPLEDMASLRTWTAAGFICRQFLFLIAASVTESRATTLRLSLFSLLWGRLGIIFRLSYCVCSQATWETFRACSRTASTSNPAITSTAITTTAKCRPSVSLRTDPPCEPTTPFYYNRIDLINHDAPLGFDAKSLLFRKKVVVMFYTSQLTQINAPVI